MGLIRMGLVAALDLQLPQPLREFCPHAPIRGVVRDIVQLTRIILQVV